MGSINYGTQNISVQFFAPADAKVVNKRSLNIIQRGIYKGGYLSKVSDTLVNLSPLVVELGDADHQVRVETANPISITVGVSTPYIILRWAYAETPTNYMDVLAVGIGSIVANDVILGKCLYVGSTLTSFDYSERANPNVFDLFLKVEPTETPSMYVHIRAGRVNYGSSNKVIVDQISSVFAVPTVDPRIDVIYVDTDGVVKVFTGSESSPPLAPNYNSKKVLAELTLQTSSTEITTAMIRDVRSPL